MQIVDQPITMQQLKELSQSGFGNFVKAVVDVKRQIMVVDADLHADEEAWLIQEGSQQKDLWGINLYPEAEEGDWIEFDSMINVRPTQNNASRSVEDPVTRDKIVDLVNQLMKR